MEYNFPEIVKHKPDNKNIGDYWWEIGTNTGYKIRINILDYEIAQLKAKVKKPVEIKDVTLHFN